METFLGTSLDTFVRRFVWELSWGVLEGLKAQNVNVRGGPRGDSRFMGTFMGGLVGVFVGPNFAFTCSVRRQLSMAYSFNICGHLFVPETQSKEIDLHRF